MSRNLDYSPDPRSQAQPVVAGILLCHPDHQSRGFTDPCRGCHIGHHDANAALVLVHDVCDACCQDQ